MRPAMRAQRLALIFVALLLAGSRSDCDTDPPTLTCTAASFTLDPGECVELENPCGARWERLDELVLCNPPPGVYLVTERTRKGQVMGRSLCAQPTATPVADFAIETLYTTRSDLGEGVFSVTIRDPDADAIRVTATATPAVLFPGETSQLDVEIEGGTPPYGYRWSPSFFIDDSSIPNPVVNLPLGYLDYTLTVTDSLGETGSGSVRVSVELGLTVTATPDAIAPGESSQLEAQPAGGSAPYRYFWTPEDSLDDPTSSMPIATPDETTTYQAIVLDAGRVDARAEVTVAVDLVVTTTATPAVIGAGETSRLKAFPQGGLRPYSFLWQPAGSLDDPTAQDPFANPDSTTTYTVIVTDSLGEQQLADATVEVMEAGIANLSVQLAPSDGIGTVTTDPPGIECGDAGSDCDESYPPGTVVTLYPTPAPGSVFVGWNGDPECALGHVTMDASKLCEAVFDLEGSPSHASLRIIGISGNGRLVSDDGGIDCGIGTINDCAEIYPLSSDVLLSAIAEPGYSFAAWSGDCSAGGSSPEIVVSIAGETRCEASFSFDGGGE